MSDADIFLAGWLAAGLVGLCRSWWDGCAYITKGKRREGFYARFLTCDCVVELDGRRLFSPRHVWHVHIY